MGSPRFNEANESKKRDQQLHRFADLRFQVAAAAAASVCIRDSVHNAPCISDYSLYVIPILRGLVTLNIWLWGLLCYVKWRYGKSAVDRSRATYHRTGRARARGSNYLPAATVPRSRDCLTQLNRAVRKLADLIGSRCNVKALFLPVCGRRLKLRGGIAHRANARGTLIFSCGFPNSPRHGTSDITMTVYPCKLVPVARQVGGVSFC